MIRYPVVLPSVTFPVSLTGGSTTIGVSHWFVVAFNIAGGSQTTGGIIGVSHVLLVVLRTAGGSHVTGGGVVVVLPPISTQLTVLGGLIVHWVCWPLVEFMRTVAVAFIPSFPASPV